MSYNEFVVLHPSIDLILEIIKGLGPTLVALLAIVLNHKNTVKRDKENRKNSLYYTIQKEMLDKFIELSQLQWSSGASLIEGLSEQNEDKRDDMLENYTHKLYSMLYKAQEICDYYYTMFENFHINVDCSEIVEVSRQYSDDLNSIVDKYEVIWKNERCMRIINQKLDDMRDEVMAATGKVKDYTNCCMSKVSQKLCQQLE